MNLTPLPLLSMVFSLATAPLIGTAQDAAVPKKKTEPLATARTVQKTVQAQATTNQADKPGWGRFVSFKEGTLTLKGNSGELIWNNIPVTTKIARWDEPAHQYIPSGTVEALDKVQVGTWVFVGEKKSFIRVGAGKESHVSGSFVSFKNDRLLMIGKDLGNYAQKGGTEIHFQKFAADVPVYKSVNGGDYEFAGPAETILPQIKEGDSITVYGEGDDNFTRIEIGLKKRK